MLTLIRELFCETLPSFLLLTFLWPTEAGNDFRGAKLIEGCKRNDQSCYKSLYDRYAMRLMTIALRYSNNTFEAEDILQESFIRIFRTIHSFGYKGSFEGWLKKIVVHTAINHFHKHKKHFPQAEENAREPDTDCEEVLDRIGADELISAIQSLPDGYRMVFNLYELEGYTHKEIGDILGISEGTSKSQLSKAKSLLRKLLVKFDYTTYELG